MESPKEYDAAFISVLRTTEDTERIYDDVMGALNLLPHKLKEQLAALGVKIVLTPTISEAFTATADPALAGNGYVSWKEYSPTAKTLYIAEGPPDTDYGLPTYDDVATGLLYAFAYLRKIDASGVFSAAIAADYERIPPELAVKYGKHLGPRDPFDHYARMASLILHMRDNDPNSPIPQIFAEAESVFPKSTALTRQSLSGVI
jgi:hypothetical protein